MTALLPDWMLVVATMLAIAVFVTGRIRLAALLAAPAMFRFIFWPTAVQVLRSLPIPVLLLAALLIMALAGPLIVVRLCRKLLIAFVGAAAADYAIGRALGQGLIDLFSRQRS